MKYFKNTELAKLYNISEKSVRNWIEATQSGKLGLQLHTEGDKVYIANSSKNTLLLGPLVEKGKKYRNTRGFKLVTPTEAFYELYSPKQILDIIANLDIHREIPYQYNYFDGGAEHWDKYTQRLLEENLPSSINATIDQLQKNWAYLDGLLEGYKEVNVIDLGVGNGLPAVELLRHLMDKGVLRRYVAIDVSQDMLTIAKRNLQTWLGIGFPFEGHVRDIGYDRFDDLLVAETFGENADNTVNIITLFGGTVYNLREPERALRTLSDSIGKKDIIISDCKLDSEKARRYFDFASNAQKSVSDFRGKSMLDLLGINPSFYTVEQFFDEQKMMRQASVRLNVALSIAFELDGKQRTIDLNKGDRILLWRAWHLSALQVIQLFDNANLELSFASRSNDLDFIFMISHIKISQPNQPATASN